MRHTPPAVALVSILIFAICASVSMAGIGGAIANADGQPDGALNGVVVFCNAGHGWTAVSSGWTLQRPLVLDMNEDYGNIDQLNLFAAYLYNAGATVVPYRPVGYQPIEIVIDNDDPAVTFTGEWNDSTATADYYENNVTVSNVPYRWAFSAETETATARYTPTITADDFYPVYCWTRGATDRVEQTYRIAHSGGIAEVAIDHMRVGQGWIWLGNYYFESGSDNYVEITNAAQNVGIVVADAIRFGVGMGDVPGYGTDQPSGFPRDEEAARYWAESEAGFNAVGLPSSIWNCCSSDGNDNVATATRWARYMNLTASNNDRWRRVFIEFHTNAANTTAKGTVALLHTTDPTTNQQRFADILGGKIEDDMVSIEDQIEHTWGRRGNVYAGQYGAISGYNTSNEFDATILEVAFHDTVDDAENLRNLAVRDVTAQSTVNGIIDFLSDTTVFPDTQVQRVYPPNRPQNVSVTTADNNEVTVNWSAPTTELSANPATGYKVYRSTNGYGFGNATIVNDAQATSTILTNIPANTTVYLRIVATNAGGESMPSEVLAVRRAPSATAEVLIVNGYDRIGRQQNPTTYLPGRGPTERQIARAINSFDYVIQHAEAIASAGKTFDAASNEAVINGDVQLENYKAVVWILGEEMSNTIPASDTSATCTDAEQQRLAAYLNNGGGLFISGSEIAWDLDYLSVGQQFFENTLGADYAGDDAETYTVIGSAGIMAGINSFGFSGNGQPYDADWPDQIEPYLPGAISIFDYVGGNGGSAGIQYDAGHYKTVVLGFPFETIDNVDVRDDIMQRILMFLLLPTTARADFDRDGDVDQSDFGHLQACYTGNGIPQTDPECTTSRFDADGDIDGDDYNLFINCFSGPNLPADPDC